MKIFAAFFVFLFPAAASAQQCSQSLWDHVYNRQRLKVVESCVTVTGTIVDATATRKHPSKDGQRHEADADNHGWLKLDPQFEKLLIPGNSSEETGNLVFECVCQYPPPKQADAVSACKGFKSKVVIPPVGSRVSMTGSLVEDLDHKPIHREIHPVTTIRVLPR